MQREQCIIIVIKEVVPMKNKWFVSLLMVVVMMCACWTGAVAENERKTYTS